MKLAIVRIKRCMRMRRIDAIGPAGDPYLEQFGVELEMEIVMSEIEHCKQGNTLECVTPRRIQSQ